MVPTLVKALLTVPHQHASISIPFKYLQLLPVTPSVLHPSMRTEVSVLRAALPQVVSGYFYGIKPYFYCLHFCTNQHEMICIYMYALT